RPAPSRRPRAAGGLEVARRSGARGTRGRDRPGGKGSDREERRADRRVARSVVIVPYSSALPVLLFVYSLVSRFGTAGDVEACLAEISSLLDAMAGVVENKI